MVSNEGHKTSYIKFAVKWIAVYLLTLQIICFHKDSQVM